MSRWLALPLLLLLLALLVGGSVASALPSSSLAAPILLWQKGGCHPTWCEQGWYASPAVADLDGDGKPEVIWTDYRTEAVNGADGSTKWIVDNPGGGRGWPSVVVADLANNGKQEVVTALWGGWVAVYNSDGSPFAGWPRQVAPGSELRSLAVGDVDGSGTREILVCSGQSQNQWYLLDYTGSLRPGWPVQIDQPGEDSSGCFNENVGLADLDGDGHLEIIGPNDTHYVVGYRDNGTRLLANLLYGPGSNGLQKSWGAVGFNYYLATEILGYANCQANIPPLQPRPNFSLSAPSFADVNGDGKLEVIIVGNQYDCRTNPYTDLFHIPYILNADRSRWTGSGYDWTTLPAQPPASAPLAENYNVIENALPNPVVADLDGDGKSEILYSSYDGRVHAFWLDKTEHGNWPFQVTHSGDSVIRFASEPVVADLDNDGHAEVLFTTWTQIGSHQGGQLVILDYLGNLLQAVDLPRDPNSDWDGALGAPTIANIDSNPDMEIVIGTAHTGLVAYRLPGSSNARLLWATGRGNSLRTGQAAPNPVGSTPTPSPTPSPTAANSPSPTATRAVLPRPIELPLLLFGGRP